VIDRRTFIWGATVAALATPLLAEARPAIAHRMRRIGILGEFSPVPWTVRTSAAHIECRWAEGRRDRLPELAAELVAFDVDLIVTGSAAATRAATSVTRTLPIVFVAGGDPVDQGLVANLIRPGGNVTGLSLPSDAEIARARLRLLSDAVLGIDRIGVLWNPDSPPGEHALRHLREAAWPVVSVYPFEARSAEDLERSFADMRTRGIRGLLVLPDVIFSIHARRVVDLAAEYRLPSAYGARSFAEAGGLMALYGNTAEVIRRAAAVIARVLGGTSPATLPVETLTDLELTINLKAARRLEMSLPSSLLSRAHGIIES
jgi:putative tryptophan/tyrosine transport system substrate-binding protein